MFGTPENVPLRTSKVIAAVGEFPYLRVKINHLALRVVDDSHAVHQLSEWTRVAVVKHYDLIILTAVLA